MDNPQTTEAALRNAKQTGAIPGAELIAHERRRQIAEEGWTLEHDLKEHPRGEILSVAGEIISWLDPGVSIDPDDEWGLIGKHSRLPGGDRRLLVIAGALIAAELDRLASVAELEAGT